MLRVFPLIAISLFALGIAVVLFEGLVANHRANFVPPCPGAFCYYVVNTTEVYFGLFPTIAGVIMLGVHKAARRTSILAASRP